MIFFKLSFIMLRVFRVWCGFTMTANGLGIALVGF